MSLFAELKRRKVFKVGGAYLVVAWLLIQVAATVAPQLQLPEWAPRLITLILLIGFPIAVLLAWMLDVTPEGVMVEGGPTGNRRMFAISGTLAALAIAWFYLAQPTVHVAPNENAPNTKSGASAPVHATADNPESEAGPVSRQAPKKSIAVLPFTDLSPGKDQEYFSDGIAEEILNALVRVKDLKVAGRTSSFYFKGRSEDLRKIGETLGVAHILEGSVRKQGDKVRITAQLIQTEDGFHLWSETYDGDLSDVFELQERIARAITGKLEVILQGDPQQRLVPVATRDPEAYALYLQATGTFNRRDSARYPDAVAQLEQALRLDPGFARAHARLAAVHAIRPSVGSADMVTSFAAAEHHARRALELDATLAEPHAVEGFVRANQRRYPEHHAAFARALALDPDDVTTNFWHAVTLINTGYRRRGIEFLDRVLALDPMLPNALAWRAGAYLRTGDIDTAERLLRRAAEGGLAIASLGLSDVEMRRGHHDAAVRELAQALGRLSSKFPPEATLVFARACLGEAEAKPAALAIIDAYLARKPVPIDAVAVHVLLRSGEIARGLALMQDAPTANDALTLGNVVWGANAAVRTAPEFPQFARRSGLAAWWDRNGAPDLCRKASNGDYVCD